MIKNIDVYELPETLQEPAFNLYEVKGKNIVNREYPHKTDQPHRHTYYEICIFDHGAGRHDIDFRSFPIHSHSIHFLTPGQVHLISREKHYHGYLLVFSRDFYSLGAVGDEAAVGLSLFQ